MDNGCNPPLSAMQYTAPADWSVSDRSRTRETFCAVTVRAIPNTLATDIVILFVGLDDGLDEGALNRDGAAVGRLVLEGLLVWPSNVGIAVEGRTLRQVGRPLGLDVGWPLGCAVG